MALINQNLEDVEDVLLKADWYEAEISDSEIKEGPKGEYVKWEFNIGKRKIWDNMSLGNQFGLKKLKSLVKSCGINPDFLRDTEELHGKSVLVKVAIEVDETGTYDDKNVIKSYKESDNKLDNVVEETNINWG